MGSHLSRSWVAIRDSHLFTDTATRRVNFRERWRGHLWQGRFGSCVLDDQHLRAAARYVEMNPVRASLVGRPEEYRWSNTTAHLAGRDDALVMRDSQCAT